MSKTHTVSTYMNDELFQRIKAKAKAEERSVSWVINKLVREGLARKA